MQHPLLLDPSQAAVEKIDPESAGSSFTDWLAAYHPSAVAEARNGIAWPPDPAQPCRMFGFTAECRPHFGMPVSLR